MCGEIDGVVLGSWTTVDEHSVASEVDDDTSHAAYWAAAAAWSDAWDQRVIDRVSHLVHSFNRYLFSGKIVHLKTNTI